VTKPKSTTKTAPAKKAAATKKAPTTTKKTATKTKANASKPRKTAPTVGFLLSEPALLIVNLQLTIIIRPQLLRTNPLSC